MSATFLQQRRDDLERLAAKENLDWKASLSSLLADDHRGIVAGLATLLKLNIRGVFDPSKSLDTLQSERRAFEEQNKQLADLHRRFAS